MLIPWLQNIGSVYEQCDSKFRLKKKCWMYVNKPKQLCFKRLLTSLATCFGCEWFYLPPLQFAQMRLGQRFDDPVSLSPPFHLYLKKKIKNKKKKAHTILLFPLSLADGHKGRGREKAWADKQTEGEMKDHKRSSREDGRHHFQTWKKSHIFMIWAFFF